MADANRSTVERVVSRGRRRPIALSRWLNIDDAIQSSDGQAAAIVVLRRLRQMNGHRVHRKRSADLLARTIAALTKAERLRFLAVISEWLINDLIGLGNELEDYAELVRFREAKRIARMAKHRDSGFQRFLSTVQVTSAHFAT